MSISILFTLLFWACNDSSAMCKTNQTVTDLVEDYINSPSFFFDSVYISRTLSPYEYYERKIVDGFEAPPPDSYYSLNEREIAKVMGVFSDHEISSLRRQILDSSSNICLPLVGMNIGLTLIECNKDRGLFFFKPIFNLDSTAAYLQCHFYNKGFFQGEGVILRRTHKNWKVESQLREWMN